MSQNKVVMFAILALFFLLGLSYSAYTALWNAPSEIDTFAYCEYIAKNHSLPRTNYDDDHSRVTRAYHPPLYFILGSLFCNKDSQSMLESVSFNEGIGYHSLVHPPAESVFPYSGNARRAHLLRIATLLVGGIAVCFVYMIMITLFPEERLLAAACTLFVATNPGFIHISASVSNEPLGATLSTIFIFMLTKYAHDTLTTMGKIAAGFLLGGALLSKASALFLVPLTFCSILWCYSGGKKAFVKDLLIILGIAGLVSGWWFVENMHIIKNLDGGLPWYIRRGPLSLKCVLDIIKTTFMSFFGYFGAMKVPLMKAHYFFYGSLLLLGAVGIVRLLVTQRATVLNIRVLGICFLALVFSLSIIVPIFVKYNAVHGKFFYLVIAPVAVVTFAGLKGALSRKIAKPALYLLCLLLIGVNLDVFFRILKPAYEKPAVVTSVDQIEFCCPTPALSSTTVIAQTLVPSHDNLCALRVLVSCPSKPPKGDLIFELKNNTDSGKTLHHMSFPAEDLHDGMLYYFTFPPIKNSKNKEFIFSFTALSAMQDQAVALWYEKTDCYKEGEMLINGKSLKGDLFFTAYCATTEQPHSNWEGKEAALIGQKLYVDVVELDIHLGRSKEFRENTELARRISRSIKAMKMRKAKSF